MSIRALVPSLPVSLSGGILLAAAACQPTPSPDVLDPAVVEAELRQLEDAHRAAIDAKDVDGVLEFYAPDLITVSPEGGIVHGREWIRSTCEELFRDFDFQEDFTLIDIRILGDRVAASYEYTQRMAPLAGGEAVLSTGKGMVILVRSESGAWQIEWNAYAPDAPVAGTENADSARAGE